VRVAELTAFHVRIPLRRRVRHASHERTSTDNVVIRCVLADGTEGWGEGVPREYVTGETAGSALALLRRSDVSSQLDGCPDFASAVHQAEQLQLAAVPGDERGIAGNAARCAVELAILDAYGRHFAEPLSTVTRMIAPELHQPQRQVRYSGAITASDGLKLILVAWAYRFYAFRQIKVKVGIAGQNDVARLYVIRRRVGREVELRVDANEAWAPGEAAERIRSLEPFGLAGVEQPVPHADASALADVRRETSTPIVLDESLCSLGDAEQAAEGGWCDRFNLRLSKCGGFIPTLRLAVFAREHRISCQLGCQVGETAILSAAGRQFATSVADLTAIEGSFDRHLVREPLSTVDLTFRRGGWAPALGGPGLGVDIDAAAIERVTLAKETLVG
jgi:muconate cycloisomerase